MNEKFTPPVWKIKYGMIVEAGSEKGIAILFGRPEIENDANRLLIAAAPEMYFMLYNLLFELKRGNASNPEYIAQAVPQIEDLLRRINHEQRRLNHDARTHIHAKNKSSRKLPQSLFGISRKRELKRNKNSARKMHKDRKRDISNV